MHFSKELRLYLFGRTGFRFVLPLLMAFLMAACGPAEGPILTPVDDCPNDVDKLEPGLCGCGTPDTDTDSDGVPDCHDNCIQTKNAEQKDKDKDGIGDACDPCPDDPENVDADLDELPDCNDACPNDPDNDVDKDLVCGDVDNCPVTKNPDQADRDDDGIGDACDPCPDSTDHGDTDNDGTINCLDGCPEDFSKIEPGVCGCGFVDTEDTDEDGIADCLDPCPFDPDDDKDGDTICGDVDNCPGTYNKDQVDSDMDGRGDACDGCRNDPQNDEDGDLVCGDVDSCPVDPNPGQEDVDHDGIGDVCDDIWFECNSLDDCDDDLECTIDDCDANLCIYEAHDFLCDDGNVCTDDKCDLDAGCIFEPNTVDCDDGSPCTLSDVCEDGTCVGQQNECLCGEDVDCIDMDDGDFCNGILTCVDLICQLDPGSVVTCGQPDNQCLVAFCDPSSGNCIESPVEAGVPCDDGNVCTTTDECAGGACVGSAAISCDDGNPCTDDACGSATGCTHEYNSDPCEDGNLCTTGDTCVVGECVGGPVPDCNDNNACTADDCVLGVGCVRTAISGFCTDGDACTVGDTCVNGICQSGTDLVCNDNNVCTNDSCDEKFGCEYVPANEGLGCNDGNDCTEGDTCTVGQCRGTGIQCDDGNPCTDDNCNNPEEGCLFVANTSPCEDNDMCTVGDICASKVCVPGRTVTCDDGNPCTDDSCDSETGFCRIILNTADCDDGDDCTIGDICFMGSCQSGDMKDCHDGNACTVDVCLSGECLHTTRTGLNLPETSGVVNGITDTDGSFVIVGTTKVTSDYWLARVLADGSLEWETSFGGETSEKAFDVASNGSGGFVVAGGVSSTGVPLNLNLVGFDSGGNFLWSKSYGGSRDDYPGAILKLDDGFIVAGTSWLWSYGDGWALRTDLLGQLVWQAGYGGADKQWFNDVIITANGFVFAGTNRDGDYDGYLVGTDAVGKTLWTSKFGHASAHDMIYSIISITDDLICTGYTYDGVGKYVAWVFKTSPTGVLSWQKVYAQNPDSRFEKIILSQDSGFVLGGYSGNAPWVIGVDENFETIWNWTSGASGTVYDMIPIDEGGVFVAGGKDGQGFYTFLDALGHECVAE